MTNIEQKSIDGKFNITFEQHLEYLKYKIQTNDKQFIFCVSVERCVKGIVIVCAIERKMIDDVPCYILHNYLNNKVIPMRDIDVLLDYIFNTLKVDGIICSDFLYDSHNAFVESSDFNIEIDKWRRENFSSDIL